MFGPAPAKGFDELDGRDQALAASCALARSA
jgi:hypothetical protein